MEQDNLPNIGAGGSIASFVFSDIPYSDPSGLLTPIGEFVVSEIDKGIWSLHKDGEYLGQFQSGPDAKAHAENMVLKMRDELLQFCKTSESVNSTPFGVFSRLPQFLTIETLDETHENCVPVLMSDGGQITFCYLSDQWLMPMRDGITGMDELNETVDEFLADVEDNTIEYNGIMFSCCKPPSAQTLKVSVR